LRTAQRNRLLVSSGLSFTRKKTHTDRTSWSSIFIFLILLPLVIKLKRLSWLPVPVGFLTHVKHYISFRIVQYTCHIGRAMKCVGYIINCFCDKSFHPACTPEV